MSAPTYHGETTHWRPPQQHRNSVASTLLLFPYYSCTSLSPEVLLDILPACNHSWFKLSLKERQAFLCNCGEGTPWYSAAPELRRAKAQRLPLRGPFATRGGALGLPLQHTWTHRLLTLTVASTYTSHSKWRTDQMHHGEGHWTTSSTSTPETFRNSLNNYFGQGD